MRISESLDLVGVDQNLFFKGHLRLSGYEAKNISCNFGGLSMQKGIIISSLGAIMTVDLQCRMNQLWQQEIRFKFLYCVTR